MKYTVFHLSKMKGVSGSENHLLTLLSGLNKERFRVHLGILTEARHLDSLQEYKRQLEQHQVQVSFFIMPKYGDWSLGWRLRNAVRQAHADIVHTHLMHADVYGLLAAKLAGIPIVVSSRHNDDLFRRYFPLIWLNRLLACGQRKIIVISDWVGQFIHQVEHIPRTKIVKILYGLDPAALSEQADPQYVRQQFQLPGQAPVIGTIGRLTAQKGQTFLLQAVKLIQPQYPDLRVLLLGDGELRDSLEQEAKSLGIAQNIIFTGYRSDALHLLAGFDFFVLPSLWEGFGLVLLEAMACKKAIVASRVSAIPESVVDGQTGLLVPPEQPEPLADAMLRLLRNRDLANAMGRAGYDHLRTHFSVAQMVQATEALYLGLVDRVSR